MSRLQFRREGSIAEIAVQTVLHSDVFAANTMPHDDRKRNADAGDVLLTHNITVTRRGGVPARDA